MTSTLPTTPAAPPTDASFDSLADTRAVALGRLTIDFAHELRNSLTGVKCYLELLSDHELPETLAPFVGDLDEVIDKMTELSARWLEVARGNNALSVVNTTLKQLVELLDRVGISKQSPLSIVLDDDSGRTTLDPTTLESALLALLVEASRRRPVALEVRSTRCGAITRVEIRCDDPRETVERPLDLEALGGLLGATIKPLPTPVAGYQIDVPVSEETGVD